MSLLNPRSITISFGLNKTLGLFELIVVSEVGVTLGVLDNPADFFFLSKTYPLSKQNKTKFINIISQVTT